VTWPTMSLLFAAGIAAGLTGSIAGLASLFSYPALLAAGLTPLAANVTNTVALTFNTVGTVLGSRPELRGQDRGRLVHHGLIAISGGLTGGLLLVLTPPSAFKAVVPVLIALGSVVILLPRRPVAHLDRPPRWLPPAVFAIGLYGGYFGAAAGVLLLAVLLRATVDSLAVANAWKNLILGLANGAAAVLFALTAPVHWAAVPPLALGLLVGGSIGPAVVRRSPVRVLRWVIALAGLGLAVKLAFAA
jgi:uncharacterized membrane protein YfcA